MAAAAYQAARASTAPAELRRQRPAESRLRAELPALQLVDL
jgi:hypothetical protein